MKDTRRAAAAARRKAAPAPQELTGRLAALAGERLAIEGVSIEIDGGRFPAKVVAGWPATIEADIFSDGHDSIDAAFLFRRAGTQAFHELPMTFLVNDRWQVTATFPENAVLRGELPRLARPLRHLAQGHPEEARRPASTSRSSSRRAGG